MQTLDRDDIEQIFKLIENAIDSGHIKRITYLQDIKPAIHESNSLEWRYRLEGYLHAMEANDAIDKKCRSEISQKLIGISPVSKKRRPGRSFDYSIDIFADDGRKFSFNCPAENPTDAYFQVTKRVAYKSIPDINLVEVFQGQKTDRTPRAKPAKIFPKNDLIYVSLV